MPAPAVYIVAVVGAVAVGYALKEFVFDPYVAPKFEQWRDEHRARREAKRRQREPVAPHLAHEATMSPDSMHKAPSTHEMKDLGSSITEGSSMSRSLPPSTGLRNRRSNAGPSSNVILSGSGLMDAPNDNNIPITPLAPQPNPWSSIQASRSPTLTPSQSPFELGSESATLPSVSPKSRDVSLSASQASLSPFASPPRIQLPTPAASDIEDDLAPSSPEAHPDLLDWSRVSPSTSRLERLPSPTAGDAPLPDVLLSEPPAGLFAPSMSRATTDMSASFVTAQSPATDFRSFPPTEPTSPFSDSFVFSGDEEDMYSFPSHSTDSLPGFVPPEELHRQDGLTFVVGNTAGLGLVGRHDDDAYARHSDEGDDSLSDGTGSEGSSGGFSDESWGEFSAPRSPPNTISPRH